MVILLVLIAVIYIITHVREQEPEKPQLTRGQILVREEENMSVAELNKRYFDIKKLSNEEVLSEVKGEVERARTKGLKVTEFDYDFDPNDEKNWDKVYGVIVKIEDDYVNLYGYDTIFFSCIAETEENANYCLKIDDLYRRAECAEGTFFLKALREKNPELCKDAGTNKLYPWCMAFLNGDASYCDNTNFENVLFKNNCVAFATKDVSLCERNKADCHYDYFTINAVYENDASICDGIYETEPGGEKACRMLVLRNASFCKTDYLIGILSE